MKTGLKASFTFAVLLFLALGATGWFMLYEGNGQLSSRPSTDNGALNLGFQHSLRLQIAAARAAADALGMKAGDPARYGQDYRMQLMQIQADSEGLDRWAAHDASRQGLLLEIRASLAGLRIALDQKTGSSANPASAVPIPLLPALSRAETALSNYSASVLQGQPTQRRDTPASEKRPWLVMTVFLVELVALAWLFFSDSLS
ncbi:MAG TPA: hypothetical protein VFN53_11355 [Acidobacteriaceae bacterium]|nr:hypothetical protein [Acidobacteriaceae bacterium]